MSSVGPPSKAFLTRKVNIFSALIKHLPPFSAFFLRPHPLPQPSFPDKSSSSRLPVALIVPASPPPVVPPPFRLRLLCSRHSQPIYSRAAAPLAAIVPASPRRELFRRRGGARGYLKQVTQRQTTDASSSRTCRVSVRRGRNAERR